MTDIEEHRNITSTEQNARGPQYSDKAQRSSPGDLDIPPAEWTLFLDSFSHQHEGWLASISVTAGGNKSFEVSNCRLERITTMQVDEKPQIRISVLREDAEHLINLIHQVDSPLRLTFRRDSRGAHEGLDIVSKDGSVGILRFRVPARPETLDGVMTEMQHRS